MSDRDFRYTLPDGTEVEAFQVTEASRYQEALYPDWMSSRMWLTTENDKGVKKHYLKVGETETEIPEYGWLMQMPSGNIQVVDYTVMEGATKLVKEIPSIPQAIEPMADDALRLAAKMAKRPFDEIKKEDVEAVAASNAKRQAIIDSLDPEVAAEMGLEQTSPDSEFVDLPNVIPQAEVPRGADRISPVEIMSATLDRGLLFEARSAYELLQDNKIGEATKKLQDALLERTNWCDCAPGKCEGKVADNWECRRNSPLAS